MANFTPPPPATHSANLSPTPRVIVSDPTGMGEGESKAKTGLAGEGKQAMAGGCPALRFSGAGQSSLSSRALPTLRFMNGVSDSICCAAEEHGIRVVRVEVYRRIQTDDYLPV